MKLKTKSEVSIIKNFNMSDLQYQDNFEMAICNTEVCCQYLVSIILSYCELSNKYKQVLTRLKKAISFSYNFDESTFMLKKLKIKLNLKS